MSLNKAIFYGKEKRKQYRRSKLFDRSCRNHGSCPYCQEGRFYKDKRDRQAADREIKEFFSGKVSE